MCLSGSSAVDVPSASCVCQNVPFVIVEREPFCATSCLTVPEDECIVTVSFQRPAHQYREETTRREEAQPIFQRHLVVTQQVPNRVEQSPCTHFSLCQLLREMAIKSDPHSPSLGAFFPSSPSDINVRHIDVCFQSVCGRAAPYCLFPCDAQPCLFHKSTPREAS